MFLLFNKTGKGCVLDKSKKIINWGCQEQLAIRVVLSEKKIFYFFDNRKTLH